MRLVGKGLHSTRISRDVPISPPAPKRIRAPSAPEGVTGISIDGFESSSRNRPDAVSSPSTQDDSNKDCVVGIELLTRYLRPGCNGFNTTSDSCPEKRSTVMVRTRIRAH